MDNIRKLIARRINELGLDMKSVSLEMGKSHSYIQQFLERGVPVKLKEDVRAKLAGILDVSEQELGAPSISETGMITNVIPEIDVVGGMGGGGLAIVEATSVNGITFAKEAVRDHWRLPDWMLSRMNTKAAHLAAFPVQGDSMSPTIDDGNVIFIDTRHKVPSPPGIYALADEFGGVVVKRLEVTSRPGDEDVTVRIISDNPRHRERELLLAEIHIIGRYVGRFSTQ